MKVLSIEPIASSRSGERCWRGPRSEMAILSLMRLTGGGRLLPQTSITLGLFRLHPRPGFVGHLTSDHAERAGAGQRFATVHVYHLAVDVSRMIADKKRTQVRNFLQRSKTV